MDFKTADLLISTYKEATKRTRRIFIILQLIGVIFIIGYFNHRFTWLRRSIEVFQLEKGNYNGNEKTSWEDNLEFYYRVYVKAKELGGDLKFIDFDLVGLEIYIEDLPLLGAIALTIIMTWFFYANRRESGIIGEISNQISKEKDNKMIKYLFYGTSFNLIFNTIKTIDNEEESLAHYMSVKIRRTLLFLPAIFLAIILILDVTETFFIATQYDQQTVWQYFGNKGNNWARVEIIVRILLTSPLLIYCYLQSKALKKFSIEDSKKWKIVQDKFLESRAEKQID